MTNTAKHRIDGRWRDSAVHNDSVDPATGRVIGRCALAGEDEAREAVAGAVRAFRGTFWKSDRGFRARVLSEMAARRNSPREKRTGNRRAARTRCDRPSDSPAKSRPALSA